MSITNPQPQPCPIPRCALEVGLGSLLVIIAGMVLAVADQTTAADALFISSEYVSGRIVWGVSILIAGLFQLLSLQTNHKILQRWAAALGAFVSLILSLTLWHAPHITILAGMATWAFIAELYIFFLLKGAGWSDGVAR